MNPQILTKIAMDTNAQVRMADGESIEAIYAETVDAANEEVKARNESVKSVLTELVSAIENGEPIADIVDRLEAERNATGSTEIVSVIMANSPVSLGKSAKRFGRGSSEHGDPNRRVTGSDKTKCIVIERAKNGRAKTLRLININRNSDAYNQSVDFSPSDWTNKTFRNQSYKNQNEMVCVLTDAIGCGEYYQTLNATGDSSQMGPLRNVQNNIRNAIASKPKQK